MNDNYHFNSAAPDEKYVYGACRPGYPSTRTIASDEVNRWIEFMRAQGIERVCCLLEDELSWYETNLLDAYSRAFGKKNVCSAPIRDFALAEHRLLTGTILPFIENSVREKKPVVVHCSGGYGRTGHVLAAWLVYDRNMSNEEAVKTVIDQGREPREAGGIEELHALLDACRR